MKLPIIIRMSTICCLCLCGCASHVSETSHISELNEWQINLLEAEGLPTNYEQLTPKQQNTIDRIWKMISYLNEKYKQEFIYVKYIPKELNQSETLVAYPRSTGAGDGKYYVTVKTSGEDFSDDYSDFNVTDLAEELTNEFLTERFGDSYKYFIDPLACDITMAEIENGKFQWKYGASNRIFLLEELCSIDHVEEFAVEYANFLYEHELSGRCRIEILKEFPDDSDFWRENGDYVYCNYDRISMGSYSFFSRSSFHKPDTCYTVYVKYDQEAERNLAEIFHISKDYSVDEFLSKYN